MRQLLPPHFCVLLLTERLTVGALILSGICLMGTNQDAIQRAVVLVVAVVCTLLDGAFDALICMTVHFIFLLCCGFSFSMTVRAQLKHGKVFLFIAFFHFP